MKSTSRVSSLTRFAGRALTATALAAGMTLVGCKASEAPNSGFLQETYKMEKNEKIPFHRAYWNKAYNARSYDKVVVAPVNMNYVLAEKIWEKANLASLDHDRLVKDLYALGDYTQASFTKAFAEDPKKRFTVVKEADERTLILELALVQLVPSKSVLHALGYAHWVPMAINVTGSTVSGSEDQGRGVIAIEGRVRDGKTGEVIGMFADRERPPVAFVDLKSLTWWAPAKMIVDGWAEQLVEIANKPKGETVKDSPSFELLVW